MRYIEARFYNDRPNAVTLHARSAVTNGNEARIFEPSRAEPSRASGLASNWHLQCFPVTLGSISRLSFGHSVSFSVRRRFTADLHIRLVTSEFLIQNSRMRLNS